MSMLYHGIWDVRLGMKVMQVGIFTQLDMESEYAKQGTRSSSLFQRCSMGQV